MVKAKETKSKEVKAKKPNKNFLTSVLAKIDNEYASIASTGMVSDICEYVDTGNYAFNALISGSIFKGIASNKVMGLAGEPSTGKTYIALSICEKFLLSSEDSLVVYIDSEGAVDREILEERSIDTERFLYLPISTVEELQAQVVAIINKLVADYPDRENRPKLMFVLDSLGLLSTKSEMSDADKGEEKGDMGRRAKLLKGAFRVLTLKMSKYNIPMIVTNHIYASMSAYSPSQMSGGNSLRYSAHFIVYLTKSKDNVKEAGKRVTIGSNIKFSLVKGRKSVEGKSVIANLSFKSGLDRYSGLFEIATEGKVFKREGNSYILPDGTKLTRKDIDNDPSLYYTQEVLEKIDGVCKNIFMFGGDETYESTEKDLEDSEEMD